MLSPRLSCVVILFLTFLIHATYKVTNLIIAITPDYRGALFYSVTRFFY